MKRKDKSQIRLEVRWNGIEDDNNDSGLRKCPWNQVTRRSGGDGRFLLVPTLLFPPVRFPPVGMGGIGGAGVDSDVWLR